MVAERWTHLLQQEFASQGEMENQVGMETTLFGGPPEIGNLMKLANGQIGFMGIFAHPLFANVTDVIPAMGFAASEIINNKGVWITRIEQEKRRQNLMNGGSFNDGAVSPRSQSPASRKPERLHMGSAQSTGYFPTSPLRHASNPPSPLQPMVKDSRDPLVANMSQAMPEDELPNKQSGPPQWKSPFAVENGTSANSKTTSGPRENGLGSPGVLPSSKPQIQEKRPEMQARRSSNTVPHSQQMNGVSQLHDASPTTTAPSSERGGDKERRKSDLRKSNYTSVSVPLMYDDFVPNIQERQVSLEQDRSTTEKPWAREQVVSAPKYCVVHNRPSSQTRNQARNSGRLSAPSTTTTDRSSMATSGGQTYSTFQSSILSPATEATSFLSIESGDEQLDDNGKDDDDPWRLMATSRSNAPHHHDRAKSSPCSLPEVVVTKNIMPRVSPPLPPAVNNGDSGGGGRGRTKSPIKTVATAVVQEPGGGGQEMVSSWEDDSEKSMKRRISRFRFWGRKKADEEDSP
jgi:3',5'-cyclic-nucleotide phosphodiesterase